MSQWGLILGYAPRANITFKMSDSVPSWHGITVRTDSMGMRQNGEKSSADMVQVILIAGDSFTFGARVEGKDTWGACIEGKTGMGVLNAGVWGYGTAQSLLRIELRIDRYGLKPDLISLSRMALT